MAIENATARKDDFKIVKSKKSKPGDKQATRVITEFSKLLFKTLN